MGSMVSIDSAVRGAKLSERVKKKYIDKGVMFDDGADNAWGAIIESDAYGYFEQLACYDPSDPDAATGIREFTLESNLVSMEHHCGPGLFSGGPAVSALLSESCENYNDWQHRIKAVFDPANASEGSFYVDPDYVPDERMPAELARVQADRAPLDPSSGELQ